MVYEETSFGKKIIVTRPKISGNTLSTRLRSLGCKVYDYPCIEIQEIINNQILKKKLIVYRITVGWYLQVKTVLIYFLIIY